MQELTEKELSVNAIEHISCMIRKENDNNLEKKYLREEKES